MPTTLSIRNAPDNIVAQLKARATRNHRSLQGELLAIIETAARETALETLSSREILTRVRAAGIHSPAQSVVIVRRARDSRHADRRR